MIRFEVDHHRCLRSLGIDCRNCVRNCVMKILGIKHNQVSILKPEDCILCLNCVGACMVDLSVIKTSSETI